jgi:hypothetical protein
MTNTTTLEIIKVCDKGNPEGVDAKAVVEVEVEVGVMITTTIINSLKMRREMQQ